jgi:hypothetical protein
MWAARASGTKGAKRDRTGSSVPTRFERYRRHGLSPLSPPRHGFSVVVVVDVSDDGRVVVVVGGRVVVVVGGCVVVVVAVLVVVLLPGGGAVVVVVDGSVVVVDPGPGISAPGFVTTAGPPMTLAGSSSGASGWMRRTVLARVGVGV